MKKFSLYLLLFSSLVAVSFEYSPNDCTQATIDKQDTEARMILDDDRLSLTQKILTYKIINIGSKLCSKSMYHYFSHAIINGECNTKSCIELLDLFLKNGYPHTEILYTSAYINENNKIYDFEKATDYALAAQKSTNIIDNWFFNLLVAKLFYDRYKKNKNFKYYTQAVKTYEVLPDDISNYINQIPKYLRTKLFNQTMYLLKQAKEINEQKNSSYYKGKNGSFDNAEIVRGRIENFELEREAYKKDIALVSEYRISQLFHQVMSETKTRSKLDSSEIQALTLGSRYFINNQVLKNGHIVTEYEIKKIIARLIESLFNAKRKARKEAEIKMYSNLFKVAIAGYVALDKKIKDHLSKIPSASSTIDYVIVNFDPILGSSSDANLKISGGPGIYEQSYNKAGSGTIHRDYNGKLAGTYHWSATIGNNVHCSGSFNISGTKRNYTIRTHRDCTDGGSQEY